MSDPEASSSSAQPSTADPMDQMTAEQLFEKGKELRQAGGEHAHSCMTHFQKAVEKKVKAVGSDVHPELAEYYFSYSDALMAHQEEEAANKTSVESGAEGDGDDQEEEDMEIVWECLETARLCFQAYKDDCLPASSSTESAEVLKKDGLYRIHMRLGDVLSETQNWADSVEEFTMALKLAREKYGEADENLVSPIFQLLAARANNKSLGKTSTDSLKLIIECREIVKAYLARDDIPAEKREKRELLLEELTAYEQQCSHGLDEAAEGEKAQAGWQTYQLGVLQPYEEPYTTYDGQQAIRRRVDLNAYYQQYEQAAAQTAGEA